MASINLQGTTFTMRILPLDFQAQEGWANVEFLIENEYVVYKKTEKASAEKIEEWTFSMFRLLAGAYKREYNVNFDDLGVAIDLYPYTKEGAEVSREERRKKDCIMAIRMLMRGNNGKFLGGIYTLLLHREEIEKFAKILREEYEEIFFKRVHGTGEYLFVGVSPWGYTGCNYWYFDPSGKVKKGDCVWVEMGSHNTRQIVCVDSVRYFTKESAPYAIDTVKRVLNIATQEEVFARGLLVDGDR